ncbi:MAG: PQQ-binding-like beta-propeller repeat protein [Bryobacterales bacterium]|nr:PQQ-binding-like beta-propeller repeat protein [Bryobacterales bacterium]
MNTRVLLPAGLILLLALPAASNWPQWRGPHSNGAASSVRELPVKWTQTENVLWRAKLPSWSAATPIIWGDTVFVTSAEEGFVKLGSRQQTVDSAPDKVFLIAVNRKDGSERWRREIDRGNKLFRKQNSASPSPITDGKHVWIMTGNGKFACFTMEGKEVWKRDIQADYGQFGLNHGYASTPLLHEGRLFVQVLHGMLTDDPSYVLAANPATGKTLWKVIRPTDAIRESPDNYATPQIVVTGGKEHLVISGADYVTGHDLDTGKELWRIGGFNPTNNPANRTIASSVVIGDRVFTTSTRGRPFIGFKAGGTGNLTGKNELWTNNLGADVPTPTTDGKYIYVLVDNGVLNCLEAETGNVVYQGQRIELGTYSSSPLLADGKIYCTNEEGTTTVVKAGPEFEILGVSKLDNHTLASPVAVDNQIFLRSADYLYCIQKK